MFLEQREAALKEAEKERDSQSLRAEAMAEQLKSSGVEFDASKVEKKDSSLIEQYKTKLAKAQKDLDAKIREGQEKDRKYDDLKAASERNEKILRKQMDEIT